MEQPYLLQLDRVRAKADSVTFIAEFTTNHLGNPQLLMRMVSEAQKSGCKLFKLQQKNVDQFYTLEKLAETMDSPYGRTYQDYRQAFELFPETFDRFDAECKTLNCQWFCTLHNLDSFILPKAQTTYQSYSNHFKIASINARNIDFIKSIVDALPEQATIVLSVAGSTLREIEISLNAIPRQSIIVNHCVAEYPCTVNRLRLGNIPSLIQHFADDRIAIGYSGHEEGLTPSYVAIDLGAKYIERHFCITRQSPAHHIKCALEPDELASLIQIKNAETLTLPPSAIKSKFGMSNKEANFLKKMTYGHIGP